MGRPIPDAAVDQLTESLRTHLACEVYPEQARAVLTDVAPALTADAQRAAEELRRDNLRLAARDPDLLAVYAYELGQDDAARSDAPPVVCICGSTRFAETMNEVSERLTLDGKIVVRPEVVTYSDADDPQRRDPAVKKALDELHKRKIDLAGEVFVVDVDGYVGESTRSEIAYAEAAGKPVRYYTTAALPR